VCHSCSRRKHSLCNQVAQKMKGAGGVDKELVASIITKIRKDILGADVDEPTSAHAERKVCRHEVHAV
jgi:hypothetical protein